MDKRLELLDKRVKEAKTNVTCPICGQSQLVGMKDLNKIYLVSKSVRRGTDRMQIVNCKQCKKQGRTTLINVDDNFYDEITSIVCGTNDKQLT